MTDAQHAGAHRAGRPDSQPVQRDEADLDGRHRGDNIVLNDAAFEGREQTQLHHARMLDAISTRTRGLTDEDAVGRIVDEEIDRSGIELPPVQRDRIVEQMIRGGGPIIVSKDDGTVLHGDADPVALQNPSVTGPADPAHPDRPAYS